MITRVFTALYNLENAANDFKTAIGGRFSPYIARQKTSASDTSIVYPYAVYQDIVDVAIWTYNTEMNSMLVQIDIYDDSSDELTVCDAQEKMWALFDEASLTIAGWNNMIMLRVAHRLTREEDPNIWRSSTDYNLMIHKQ